MGIVLDILNVLNEHEIDLRGIEIDEFGKVFLSFPTMEFAEFQHLMPKIRRVNGVEDVKTTAFMPGERERHQLAAIQQTLPDPVFAIDTRSNVIACNQAAESTLETTERSLFGIELGELIKGFNFNRWLESDEVLPQSMKVKFIQQDYLADILPVTVPDGGNKTILAGAIVMLKSELRVGQQFNAFHRLTHDCFDVFVSQSVAMKKCVKEAKRLAELESPMLIFGETGTGKEMMAETCHRASSRANEPLEVLHCASLDPYAAEIELFGVVQTSGDVLVEKAGLVERANKGSLLLDEVGELPAQLQQKVMTFIETGEYHLVGSEQTRSADVRIMATSSQDLGLMVEEGKFRKSFYYRLNVLSIVMPALKDRKQDIVALAETFIAEHSSKLNKRAAKLSKSCVDFLQQYPWPGNVRQLQNTLYRAVSLIDGNEITKEDVQLPSCAPAVTYIDESFNGTLDEEVKKFERDLLRRLYPSYPSTRQLAKKLGLSHTAIANKLREYGINKGTVKV